MHTPDAQRTVRPYVLAAELERAEATIADLRQQLAAAIQTVEATGDQQTDHAPTRDTIAADTLRWAADHIDPGPSNNRPEPEDEQHATLLAAERGFASRLRLMADQVTRGFVEPRPASSVPPVAREAALNRPCDPGFDPNEETICSPCSRVVGRPPVASELEREAEGYRWDPGASTSARLIQAENDRQALLTIVTRIGNAISPTGERPLELLSTLADDVEAMAESVEHLAAERDALQVTRAFWTPGVLGEVAAERARQDERWGEQNHRDGTTRLLADRADEARRDAQHAAANGTLTWAHVLREEVYEALAEDEPASVRRELVQVAAVAVAWVEAIDRRTTTQEADQP